MTRLSRPAFLKRKYDEIMRTLKIVLLAAFIFSVQAGYSQVRHYVPPPPAYPVEECVAMLKNDYYFLSLRNPTDTMATLDRFVERVGSIVNIGNGKKEKIKEQLLSNIGRQTARWDSNGEVEVLPQVTRDFVPLLGINANDVLSQNFSEKQYALIYETLTDERINNSSAFKSLYKHYKILTGEEVSRPIENGGKILLDYMFDYFNVDGERRILKQ